MGAPEASKVMEWVTVSELCAGEGTGRVDKLTPKNRQSSNAAFLFQIEFKGTALSISITTISAELSHRAPSSLSQSSGLKQNNTIQWSFIV